MKSLIQKYTNYNYWANQRLAIMLDPIDDLRMEMEITSSFPSINKTLLHIWDAETIWLNRLKGSSFLMWPSDNFEGDKQHLLESVLKTSNDFDDFIAQQPTDFFSNTCQYSSTIGEKREHNNVEIIQHCMNHSTFHRGQLITMLRQLGETELMSTDFITYLRQNTNNPV